MTTVLRTTFNSRLFHFLLRLEFPLCRSVVLAISKGAFSHGKNKKQTFLVVFFLFASFHDLSY